MSSSTKKSALQCLDYLHLPIMLFTCVMFVIMSRLMSNVDVWHKRLWHVSSRGHIFPTSLLLWVMCHRHQVFCRVLVARWLSSLLCHFQPKILYLAIYLTTSFRYLGFDSCFFYVWLLVLCVLESRSLNLIVAANTFHH